MPRKTIALCCSLDFAREVVEISEQLKAQGFAVILPATVQKMQAANDYDVNHYKTWRADSSDYHKKGELIQRHFKEIASSDAILVVNNTKHGKPNYIGGNTFLEMGIAFYLNKQVFILNDIPTDSPYEEEIRGFEPIVLKRSLHLMTTIKS
jgi:hypothetical protein